MNIFALTGIINALTALSLVLLVAFSKRRRLQIPFAIATVNLLLWSIAYTLWQYSTDASLALFWSKLFMLGATWIPFTYLHFIIALLFPSRNLSKYISAIYIVAGLLFGLVLLDLVAGTMYIIDGMEPRGGFEFWPIPGSLFIPYFVAWGSAVIVQIALLIYQLRRTTGVQRIQIRLLLLGLSLGYGGGMTNFFLWFNIDIPPIGNILVSLFAVLVAVAAFKHRLFNLRFIFTRSLVYILLVGAITILFVLTSTRLADYFTSLGVNESLMWFIAASLVVLGIDPLRNLFANYTDKIFYKEKIDYPLAVRNLTNAINEEIDLESLVTHVSEQLANELKLQGASILLAAYEDEVYLPVSQYKHYPKSRKSTRKVKPEEAVYHNSYLIKYLRRTRDLIVTDELERYMYDIDNVRKQEQLERVYNNLAELEAAAVIPVVRDNTMTAILVVGPKASGEAISDDDVNVIEVMSAQLGAAVERSKLYEEVQAFNVKLQKEVDKATKSLQSANVQLTEANENLKELDKAKSEFMSIASHQLRTPLAGIVGYLSMVLEGDYGKLGKEHTDVLSDVFQATQRLVRLVNTLLNVTRIEAGRFSLVYMPMDIVDVLQSEIFELNPTAQKKGIELSFHKPKTMEAMEIQADDKLREVFLNLIDNAIKYTQEGHVTVRLKKEGKDTIHVTVSDSGIGIAPQEAKKLFGKFVRGSKSSSVQPDGSGLGLYIVKKIVEGHHGKIWAESEGVGKGTVFNVVLPIHQKTSEYKAAAETIITTQ